MNPNVDINKIIKEENFKIFKYNDTHICVVKRTSMGHFCGYVGVTKKSVLYGQYYYTSDVKPDEEDDSGFQTVELTDVQSKINDISVHGGLTYSNTNLYSVDIFGDEIWWFGFDCAHYNDANLYELDSLLSLKDTSVYRDFDYTEEQVKLLSDQLKTIENENNS